MFISALVNTALVLISFEYTLCFEQDWLFHSLLNPVLENTVSVSIPMEHHLVYTDTKVALFKEKKNVCNNAFWNSVGNRLLNAGISFFYDEELRRFSLDFFKRNALVPEHERISYYLNLNLSFFHLHSSVINSFLAALFLICWSINKHRPFLVIYSFISLLVRSYFLDPACLLFPIFPFIQPSILFNSSP